MILKNLNGKIRFIAVITVFLGIASCADLPKTNDTRFLGEPNIDDEYETLDSATRKETEYKADSIIKKYNYKFAENCTPYTKGQNKRIDCVTFK
jgi:hypothetical protein